LKTTKARTRTQNLSNLSNPSNHSNLLALLLFTILTTFLAYPLSTQLTSHVLGGGADTRLMIWMLGWNTHAFTTNPLGIFDANIFYPMRFTLAYSENLIGSALIAAPVLWATGHYVLAFNLVQLTSVILCGVGAYVLGRRLGLGFAAAIVCGLVFAFSPPRFFRMGQVHLSTVQWIPFALAALHAYFDEGKARYLKLAIALAALQALTSGHGFVFLLLAMVIVIVHRLASREPVAFARRVRDAGIFGTAAVLLVGLLFVPYLAVQEETGLRRSLRNWSSPAQNFIASPSHVDRALVASIAGSDALEGATGFLFPGALPLLLAALAFARWRTSGVLLYGVITLVAVLLSIGPPLSIWPLVYWLPGLNFVRVPSRFTILALLGLGVLAGFGFERLKEWLRPSWRPAAAWAVGLLLVVEFATVPLPLNAFSVDIPDVDRWLDGRDKPFAIAEFPIRRSERLQATYMIHSMGHWQKTIHGYSGHRATLHQKLYLDLRGFPDELSLSRLADLGIDYVVVHADYYDKGEWAAVENRLQKLGGRLRLVYESGRDRVYGLRMD
jgi:hypothetical protein